MWPSLQHPISRRPEKKEKKADSKAESKALAAELPLQWRLWLDEEVYPLISKDQRRAFLALETEAQRKAFVERLWNLWARESGIGVSFRQMYQDRLAMARFEFGNTIEDRGPGSAHPWATVHAPQPSV